MTSLLYHITEWPYTGLLQPQSLQSEGFVHLSSAEQLLRTAQRWYGDSAEVGVLVLDQQKLGEALVWEDLYGHGEPFPHLYAPIPELSVVAVAKLCRDREGRFTWPPALGGASPLGEGPDQGEALIEPSRRFSKPLLPPVAVLTYFPRVLDRLEPEESTSTISGPGSAIGPAEVHILERDGGAVAVCSPGVGGPLAAVALEELIALGCQRFVVCGGAGSLRSEQDLGHLVLVSEALRDEGLSHHYLQPSLTTTTHQESLEKASEVMSGLGVPFQTGRTWTTDALYRETPHRIARRKAQGCLTVEMECAALLAVARFRGVRLVPILYCGDDLGSETWNFRDWTSAHDVQDRLFWLAVEVALALPVK